MVADLNDAKLNSLEAEATTANQDIAAAEARYRQAKSLIDEARAGLFPAVGVRPCGGSRQQRIAASGIRRVACATRC